MSVRINLRFPKPSPKIWHDWKTFSNDPGLQTRYKEEVAKCFYQLDKVALPSNKYRRFIVNEEVTRLFVSVMDRHRQPSCNPNTQSFKEGQVEGHSPEKRVMGSTADTAEEEDMPSVLQNLNIEDGPFTLGELITAKSIVIVGKSGGTDGIPREVLENYDLVDIILEFSNLALPHNWQPDMWSLVPKAGDLSKPDNYLGISLRCITAKF